MARSAKLGAWLKDELADKLADVDVVGEVRGLGTLIGIEYVRSRESLEILDPALKFGPAVFGNAAEEGLLISGSMNNREVNVGECTTLAPAYNMTDAEAEVVVERLTRAVRRAADQVLGGAKTTLPLSTGQPRPRRRPAATAASGLAATA